MIQINYKGETTFYPSELGAETLAPGYSTAPRVANCGTAMKALCSLEGQPLLAENRFEAKVRFMDLRKLMVVVILQSICMGGLPANSAIAQSGTDCAAARKWVTCVNVQAQSCEQLRSYASACGIGKARQVAIAARCGVLHCVRSSH